MLCGAQPGDSWRRKYNVRLARRCVSGFVYSCLCGGRLTCGPVCYDPLFGDDTKNIRFPGRLACSRSSVPEGLHRGHIVAPQNTEYCRCSMLDRIA